ncbi:unnamed protein product [Brassica rapa]|uniref:Protein IDA-LIKE 2 n=1 Tax=Brassica campestris TaxID=3711 RepID=A0A3P5XW29_BRACM|nr:unnamed protein product [Brassica rapa]VDC58916.1 unnamed protein product [Brassica rapa]
MSSYKGERKLVTPNLSSTMSSQNRRSRNHFLLNAKIIFLFLLLGLCNGARTSKNNVFNSQSHKEVHHVVSSSSQQFLGFLPRHFPIPASGPSKKHNDIGLLSCDRSFP